VEIPDALIDAFREERVTLFVGSGLSTSPRGGYPTAEAFAAFLCRQVVTDFDGTPRPLRDLIGCGPAAEGHCLDEVAEYYELFAGTDRLLQTLRGTFNNPTIPATQTHQDLWELPSVRQIYTTNFDPLIEKGLEMSRVRAEPRVITDPRASIQTAAEYRVFKLHGCAVNSLTREDFVITKSDYLDFDIRHPLSKLRAQSELAQNVFLFLGYGLGDPDFQSLYREVRRFAGVTAQSCFAVDCTVSPAKVSYWKKLGLHLLRADAGEAVRAIKGDRKLQLRASWFEWRGKEGAREDIKQAIAQKALTELLLSDEACASDGAAELTLILDSGTSTLAFARRLKDLLDKRPADVAGIRSLCVVTNCTAIADALRWIHLPDDAGSVPDMPIFSLYVLGGRLRTETQALIAVTTGDSALDDMPDPVLVEAHRHRPVVALMGATAVTPKGFSTNTSDETVAKRRMMACADRIVFLLDHSKFRIGGRHVFLPHGDAARMVQCEGKQVQLVTDREPPEEIGALLREAGIQIVLISG
jgi:DeoR/GlpR family transcriptional regulator of sugar metabolism